MLAHNVETVPRIFKRIRPGVPLRPLARRAHPGPRLRAGHQVQPDPRHGRDPRGGLAGAARPARRRLRAGHDHAVPPPLGAAPPRRAVGQAARSSSSSRPRPRRSASPACCPDRWCVRRTAPVACTVRRWTPAQGAHRLTLDRPSDHSTDRQPHAHGRSKTKDRRSPSTPREDEPRQAVRRDLPDGQEVRPVDRPGSCSASSSSSARRRLRALLGAARRRADRVGHGGRRRPAVRPARRDDRLRPARPEGGVQPDGGSAGRGRRRAADAAPRLEDRPGRSPSPSSRTSCTGSSAPRASCWSARATPTGCAS